MNPDPELPVTLDHQSFPPNAAHHLPRSHADDQDLVPGRRADDRRVGVRGLAPPRHPLHREPLLAPAAAEDGSHLQGEK